MNTKTLCMLIFAVSIACSGCAAEIEYWTKRMDENKKASAEGTETGGTQTGGTKQLAATPPPEPEPPPVTWPPVEWPPREEAAAQQTAAPAEPATPETPAASAPTATGFIISIKGGDKYLGEIVHETITFKTAHGPVKVTIDNFISFTQGTLQTKDGTTIKGAIDQNTIKIKTPSLGELEIQTDQIESITK